MLMCCHLKNCSFTFPTAAVNICHCKGFLPYPWYPPRRSLLGLHSSRPPHITPGLSLSICHCVWITISMHLYCLDIWNEPQEMLLCSNEVVSNATVKCEPGFLTARNFIWTVYSWTQSESESITCKPYPTIKKKNKKKNLISSHLATHPPLATFPGDFVMQWAAMDQPPSTGQQMIKCTLKDQSCSGEKRKKKRKKKQGREEEEGAGGSLGVCLH